MAPKRSGSNPFMFEHQPDLHVLPEATHAAEVNLHGGFAVDKRAGFGQIYYGMPGCGILRIDADLQAQHLIALPDHLKPFNFHSTTLGQINGQWRLILPANNEAQVVVINLDGTVDFVLTRPEFEQYQAAEVKFAPTDTVLVDEQVVVADGYGANYITTAHGHTHQWTGIFGGKTEDPHENGKFTTAHGIARHFENPQHLVIADRPNARLQIHALDGQFVASHALPAGAWPCGIDFLQWQGRWLAVIGSLVDPVKDRPAPIYIVDAQTYEVLSTIRPKEDLGIELAQHIHNVVWHVHEDTLYLVCQSWNPGHYFVLAQV